MTNGLMVFIYQAYYNSKRKRKLVVIIFLKSLKVIVIKLIKNMKMPYLLLKILLLKDSFKIISSEFLLSMVIVCLFLGVERLVSAAQATATLKDRVGRPNTLSFLFT
jgi:hypothetical protein